MATSSGVRTSSYPEILPSAILGNSGLMVSSLKFLSRFKIDFIGIKHWGVDCFAIQAKRSPPTLSFAWELATADSSHGTAVDSATATTQSFVAPLAIALAIVALLRRE